MVKGKDCGGISVTDEGFRMNRREAEERDGKGGTDAKFGEDKGLNKMDLAGKISCFLLSRRTGRDSVQ